MGFVQLLNDRCPFPCVHLVSCGKYEVSCPDYRFVPTETGTRVQGYVLAYGTQFVVQAVHVSFGECLLKIVEVFATHAPVELFQTRLVQVFEGRPEYFGGDAFLDVDSVFGPVDGRGVSYGESFIGQDRCRRPNAKRPRIDFDVFIVEEWGGVEVQVGVVVADTTVAAYVTQTGKRMRIHSPTGEEED